MCVQIPCFFALAHLTVPQSVERQATSHALPSAPVHPRSFMWSIHCNLYCRFELILEEIPPSPIAFRLHEPPATLTVSYQNEPNDGVSMVKMRHCLGSQVSVW